MASEYYQKHTIPPDFPLILRNFTREVLRLQPKNIVEFSAKYFRALASKNKFEWDPSKSRGPLPCDYPRVNIQKNLKELPTSKQPVPYHSKKDPGGKTAKHDEPATKTHKAEEAKTKQHADHGAKPTAHHEKPSVHHEKPAHHETSEVQEDHHEKPASGHGKAEHHEHPPHHEASEQKEHQEKPPVHPDSVEHKADSVRHAAPKHSHRSSEDHTKEVLNISGNMSLPSNPEEAAEAYVGNLIERSEANLVHT